MMSIITIQILNKIQITARPSRKAASAIADSNRTEQQLQMAARKSLETMSGVILNRLQPNFAAKSVVIEMLCLKAME